jgi:hypothetical protein
MCTFRSACWRHLYGAFTVWLDVEPEQSEETAPQRGAYSESEVHLKLQSGDVQEEGMETASENVAAQVTLPPRDLAQKCQRFPLECYTDTPPGSAEFALRHLRSDNQGVLQAIAALVERCKKDKKLPDGKRLYVKLGCRGDWPDIQPPDWQPPEPQPVA